MPYHEQMRRDFEIMQECLRSRSCRCDCQVRVGTGKFSGSLSLMLLSPGRAQRDVLSPLLHFAVQLTGAIAEVVQRSERKGSARSYPAAAVYEKGLRTSRVVWIEDLCRGTRPE